MRPALPLFLCLTLAPLATLPGTAGAQTTVRRPVNSRLEDLKKQADAAYRAGDFDRTVDLADQVLRSSTTDHVALYLRGSARVELGIIRRDQKLIRDGIADAREAIRIDGKSNVDYYLPYLYGMSNLTALEQKPAHAETALEVATRLMSLPSLRSAQKANLYYQRALIQLQLGKTAEADKDLASALAQDRKHLAAQLARCDLAAQSGNPDDALQKFNQAVATFPDNPLVLNNRGMFHQSHGRVKEAVADFDRAIQRDAGFVPAWTNRGFARLSSGDPAAAEQDLTRSLQLDPNQPAALSLRGTARLSRGNTATAIEDYRKVLSIDPNNPAALADLGFARFFAKDYSGALESFGEALQRDPTARFLNPWRAAALHAAGRASEAETLFRDVIGKPPAERDWFDVLTLFQLGQLTDNDLLNSITTGDATLKDAQQCESYYFIGLARARQDLHEEAEGFYRQALQTRATHLSAYRGAQFALNEFTTAINER